jgi:hypothetical protein
LVPSRKLEMEKKGSRLHALLDGRQVSVIMLTAN